VALSLRLLWPGITRHYFSVEPGLSSLGATILFPFPSYIMKKNIPQDKALSTFQITTNTEKNKKNKSRNFSWATHMLQKHS
jgi:hypothetical protein